MMKYSLTMGSGKSKIRLLYGSQICKVGSTKNMGFFSFSFSWKTKKNYKSINKWTLLKF